MKNKISKIVALTSVMIVLITGLTGCGEKVCEICGETSKCSNVQFFEDGDKLTVCEECEAQLIESFNSIFE